MRRLGRILHVSSMTGHLIVKAQTVPRIGEKVYDGELRPVGLVFDVFGPVESPYVAVKPLRSQVKPVKTLFLSESRRKKK
ncbi:MAG: H/ACA RNA-protein complex protein Gar1 [Candidatus Hecatellales archaeon]|nr:MAG: H/ACA RNA-protein complex protein Gar1 [Candidatus Hecatellales archaeon]